MYSGARAEMLCALPSDAIRLAICEAKVGCATPASCAAVLVTAVAAATLGAEALRVAEALSTAAGTAYGWALGVRTSRFF